MRNRTAGWLLTTSLAALIGGEAHAQAQPQPETQAQLEARDNALEEVVVTARRREESLQSVPVAVTALSESALKAGNVQSVEDLTAMVPGLTTLGGMNFSQITIRGQGSGTLSGTAGSHFYFNEVPTPVTSLGTNAAGGGLQYDMTSLQVLKGPQGTLFGRNSVGGAILMTTRRPGSEFGGYVDAYVGNYDNRQLTGAINIPLGEIGGVRIAGDWRERDGYVHMLPAPYYPNGTDQQNIDYKSWRFSLDLHPTEWLDNQFTYHWLDGESHGEARTLLYTYPTGIVVQQFPQIVELARQQQQLGVRTALPSSLPAATFKKIRYLVNRTDVRLGDNIRFRNIFGYLRLNATENIDNDGGPLAVVDNFSTRLSYSNQFTWEPQLQGSLFGDKLDWTAGYFYLDVPYQDPSLVRVSRTLGRETLVETRFGESSKAFYGQATYDLSALLENLKATAGVRRTEDTRRSYSKTTLASNGACGTALPGQRPDCSVEYKGKWKATTYNLSLDYQFAPDSLIYIASRRGYRGGGFNTATTVVEDQLFGPEYVTDYEIGFKRVWDVGPGALKTNVALFRQNYKGIQISNQEVDPNTNQFVGVTRNVGAAKIKGAELELAYSLEGLHLGANLAWLDFKFTRFPAAQEAALRLREDTLRPEFAYSLNGRYVLPLDPEIGEVSISANWRWQTETGHWSDYRNSQTGALPEFGTTTASVEWREVMGRPVDLSLIATNLTNKTYPMTNINNTAFGIRYTSWAEPRMVTLRLTYRFGADADR